MCWSAYQSVGLETAVVKTYPSVSVVVLTYNNLHITRECLESLMEFTEYPNWELILVDNASTDGTPDYLTQFAGQHENVKVLLNQDNLGFVVGKKCGNQEFYQRLCCSAEQ